MQLTFVPENLSAPKTLVVGIFEGGIPSAQAKKIDTQLKGFIKKSLALAAFTGKRGKCLTLLAPQGWERLVLVGLGDKKGFNSLEAEKLGGNILAHLNAARVTEAAIALEGNKLLASDAELLARLAYGAHLRSYRFDKYRTKEKAEEKPTLKKLVFMGATAKEAKQKFEPLEAVAAGVFLTRDLVNEPANVVTPESFPSYCRTLEALGVKVEVLGEKEMKKLGMHSLLCVGQGSAFESKLIIMQWHGGKKTDKPLAFVGKGVTFDTGGISIKPAAGMEEMKWDMGGAGTVTGLMKALAGRKAKVNAIGVIGVVENMPSSTAQRPGDVVTSMSGQTIEVINTDAEGRLVLADALWYTHTRFKPEWMIDLATLTGAIIVALGHEKAGLFSNNEALASKLEKAAEAVGEPLWRLPLGPEYDEMINCDIADMKNVGDGRGAGSTTAAQFLQRFVADVPWAHLDIAGTAWAKKDTAITPKGGSAFGVRLLNALVETFYEK
jgi:leucyl aminopeptidase